MPMFDYKCTACGAVTKDVYRKYSSEVPVECSECGAVLSDEDKLVGSSSFSLKGMGWAKDGYSSKSTKYSFQ